MFLYSSYLSPVGFRNKYLHGLADALLWQQPFTTDLKILRTEPGIFFTQSMGATTELWPHLASVTEMAKAVRGKFTTQLSSTLSDLQDGDKTHIPYRAVVRMIDMYGEH